MQRIGRRLAITSSFFGVFALLIQGVFAAEPTKSDENRFVNQYLFAKLQLFDFNSKEGNFTPTANADSAKATQACNNAAAIAREFDPNPYWSSEIDICFGMIDAVLKKKASACRLFKSAANKASDARAHGIQPFKPKSGIVLQIAGRCRTFVAANRSISALFRLLIPRHLGERRSAAQ